LKKLISNYLFTLLYQILLMITPFITTPYVSRVLKPEGIGIDAYIGSIVQLFVVFSILSIPIYGSRSISVIENIIEKSKAFWSIYTIQLLVSTVNIVVFILLVTNMFNQDYRDLYIIHIFTLLASTLDISWYFIGREQAKTIAIRNIILRLISIILIFSLVLNSDDLYIYILINALTLLFGQLVMWFPMLKEVKFIKVSFLNVKEHLYPISILFLPQIMIQIYMLVNKIILGNFSSETEVGFYNQANRIIKLTLGVFTALGTVLLPRMSKEFAKGNIDEVKKYAFYTLNFVLMITLPMVIGLIAISDNFVSWFLGAEYAKVAILIKLMSPVIFFVGLANVFGIQILISTNQSKKYSISIIIGSLLSLITNLMLVIIVPLSSVGTTISLLVAEGIGAIIQMYFVRKYLEFASLLKTFSKYFFASILLYIIAKIIELLYTESTIMLTFIQLIIGTLVYFICLITFKDKLVMQSLQIISRFIKRKES
jgi:O-antigen/teichoic acid export membrane protein